MDFGVREESAPCNLYVRHEGVTRFVATLAAHDHSDWSDVPDAPVRMSPNGQWLAFMSSANLAGYDPRDAVSRVADQEVYLYDAAANHLSCASCNPSGASPVGFLGPEGFVGEKEGIASLVPGWTQFEASSARYQSRFVGDNGRVFFDSKDALVPNDVNGAQDVYEYEPESSPVGQHPCSRAVASGSLVYKPARGYEVESRSGEEPAGCVGLISAGTSPDESTFLDASESGGDVFFLTTSKLSSADFDNAPDVYDAHECTAASACPPPSAVATRPCDTEASCKAGASPQPLIFGTPASGTFSGPGNVSPPPAGAKPKQTRAQKLAAALRLCRRKHSRPKRARCERQARAKYGAKQKSRGATSHRRSH